MIDNEPIPKSASLVERAQLDNSFEVGLFTTQDERHPDSNEDRILSLPNYGVWGVFDGVGGVKDGELAADTARESVTASFLEASPPKSREEAGQNLITALKDAHQSIQQAMQSRQGDKNENGGTTAALVYKWMSPEGKPQLTVASVGDSRVYRVTKAYITQITLDDGSIKQKYPNELKKARELQRKFNKTVDTKTELTSEELEVWKKRNYVTQALGKTNIKPDVFTVDIDTDDIFLLCTDGVSDNLTDPQLWEIINKRNGQSLNTIATQIVTKARNISRTNDPRHKQDDMSAVLLTFKAPKPR